VSDDDSRDLIASLQRLKAVIGAQIPASRPLFESQISRGVSIVVRLARSPDEAIITMKTPLSQPGVRLIQPEYTIHPALKHPLVIGFRQFHPSTPSNTPSIVTEFAGNRSRMHHLPMLKHPGQCKLPQPNRIAMIIIEIALAMRYVHSCGIVNRE
jgi:serine/threonine protein kinase